MSPRYLPAICPAFPHTVAIVEAQQMRRPRPHLWAAGVAAASLPSTSWRAPAAQPGQARPGTRRHRDSSPHFAEIQISQNPTGWAPQRSLAPRTCRAPLPVFNVPIAVPTTRRPGCSPNVAEDRDTTVRLRAPALLGKFSNTCHRHDTTSLGLPCQGTDTTVHTAVYFHPRHGLPDAAPNSRLQERGASFPRTHISHPCALLYVPTAVTLALDRISR